jgi:hypothetical protein
MAEPRPTEPRPDPPSRRALAAAVGAAALGAAVLLVTVVLPAEYGIDPLGTGEALGLVVLSGQGADTDIPVRSDGLIAQDEGYRRDRIAFDLEPGTFVEYKYRLEMGRAMLYSWSATGHVRSEMHSEADGAAEGTAEFFEVEASTTARHGSYVAPFPGIHGWYWLNEGDAPLTVTLHASGFFEESAEFRRGQNGPIRRRITETPGGAEGEGGR